MSVANEINRLKQAKEYLKTAIEGKGVTVPGDTKLDGYGELVESISGGGEEQNDLIDSLIQKGSAFTVSEVYNNRVTTIGQYAFQSCSSLQSVNFPSVTSIDEHAFQNCSSLQSVDFPNVTRIGSYAFQACTSLLTATFSKVATISGNNVFGSCYNLLTLKLAKSSICTLSKSNTFTSTPIAGYTTSTGGVYGSIYVPQSLIASYRAATNWTYFSSRFAAIEDLSK